jgi:hypothetical protein
MALANVAELFYARGLRVLMVDFDLEAPGLERYFNVEHAATTPERVLEKRGVIDLLASYRELRALSPSHTPASVLDPNIDEFISLEPLDNFLVTIYNGPTNDNWLKLIPAGQRAGAYSEYADRVLSWDWADFYGNFDGERFFDWFRINVERIADVILIDSRTGVTEMGGVCTHLLADVVLRAGSKTSSQIG